MRHLIIIDYNFTSGSPSVKGIRAALPFLVESGWHVTVWSHKFECPHPEVKWRRFSSLPGPGFLKFLGFSVLVHLCFLWSKLRKSDRNVIWQSTGAYLIPADVILIQFISIFYLAEMRSRGASVPFYEQIQHSVVGILEQIQQKLRVPGRRWFVVSRRLAEELGGYTASSDVLEILPNSYDSQRWNACVRGNCRDEARRYLGLAPGTAVLAFVGLGSFVRKGLGLALKACDSLRRRGLTVKLLVIGGATEQAPDLRQFAAGFGIDDLSFLLTHGRTPEVSRLLSACDGLFFPSYFEAFSLVEIEAAALGLRLYLTQHYGAEMLLRDGCNGRLLPWDSEGMADVLEQEIRSGKFFEPAEYDDGNLITDRQYQIAYEDLLDKAWRGKFNEELLREVIP